MEHVEIEDKFVTDRLPQGFSWEKAVFVYQFFYDDDNHTVQDKIAVNVLKGTVSLCTVTKEILGKNKSVKKAEYRPFSLLECKKYLGKPFVMKRRMIKENIFMDKYIYALNRLKSKYLLEIEYDEDESLKQYAQLLEGAQCVSGDETYYNENNTVIFEECHLQELKRIIELIVN